jgi:hypothetical protein
VLLKNLRDAPVEVSLKRALVGEVVLRHEGLNLRVEPPVFARHLVAADVHVGVWKERGHLAEEAV